MTAKLYIKIGNEFKAIPLFNTVTFDERLDELLDSGQVQAINDDISPISDMSCAKLVIDDGITTYTAPFYAFDTVEKRGEAYYIHSIELCEPTRRLMGILTGGAAVTQPVDGTQGESLYNVVLRLFAKISISVRNSPDSPLKSEFTLTSDPAVVALLQNTVSPEFSWQAETQFWECLKDIGDVINCIPRLGLNDDESDFTVVTFDMVNDITGEYEI